MSLLAFVSILPEFAEYFHSHRDTRQQLLNFCLNLEKKMNQIHLKHYLLTHFLYKVNKFILGHGNKSILWISQTSTNLY